MSAERPLRVVLCWHMHQPQYQDLITGEYQLPWTYLHATKDYVDMAAHLEAVPGARAVVNFAPILLEQIEDYARQAQGFLNNSGAIRDPLLAALDRPVLPGGLEQRMALVKNCLRINEQRFIDRFPPYRRLADMAGWFSRHPDAMIYAGDQFLVDLLMWYHLAWLGETVRRDDARAKRLVEKGAGYNMHDRRLLLEIVCELLSGVLGRYRALAERGQVELSVTPYGHPMVPLLLDIGSAREAMPEMHLPLLARYPGGEERARWHVRRAIEIFERHFGFRPHGCWPAEGGLSGPTLKLLEAEGFVWAASGESVLRNSVARMHTAGLPPREQSLHRPYRVAEGELTCFFRDDGLSDLIGFTYAAWHADDAVANFVHHLENIALTCKDQPDSVVSIILDGENAWEYYPENGYYFLSALYKALAEHPRLELTTFSRVLDAGGARTAHLPHLVAGSWVYGTFSTWIGDEDKNRGWDMLADVKCAFDEAAESGRLAGERLHAAERQLAICEGSDWFWWFGDYNPAETVSDFERLYRVHLGNLYQMLGVEPPEYLSHSFTRGGGAPQLGGVMRPGQLRT
jgi:alpha-amylase/alpha-mannosidase (GH57 family)